MKFLLFLVAIVVLLWLLRGTFARRRRPPVPPPAAAKNQPLPMLACAQCGVHLPVNEALPGRGGVFCGAAHRAAFESAHPE
jgi:uncharacterized protein